MCEGLNPKMQNLSIVSHKLSWLNQNIFLYIEGNLEGWIIKEQIK